MDARGFSTFPFRGKNHAAVASSFFFLTPTPSRQVKIILGGKWEDLVCNLSASCCCSCDRDEAVCDLAEQNRGVR